MALPLLSAAVVSGEALTAMTFGLCAWGAVRLVSGWCFAGGVGLTLAQIRAEADHACARGRFAIARQLYERAILSAEQRPTGDSLAVVRDYYNLAATTAMLGDFPGAGRLLLRLRPRLRCVDPHWAEHAAWLTRYVATQLVSAGEVRRALGLVELSAYLVERAGDALPAGERSVAFKEIGWVSMYAGRLDAAEAAFRRSVDAELEPEFDGARRSGVGDEVGQGAATGETTGESRGETTTPGAHAGQRPPWAPYRGAAVADRPRPRFEPDAARLGLAECQLLLGRLVEARLAFEEMRAELCSDLSGPDFAGRVLRGLGRTEAGLGNHRAAMGLLMAAHGHDVQGDRTLGAAALDLALLADLHVRRGDLGRAAELVDAAELELSSRPPRGVVLEIEAVRASLLVRDDPRAALVKVDAAMAQADHHWGADHPRMIPLLGLAAEVAGANGCLGLAERRLGRARMLARQLDPGHPLHHQLARVSRGLQRARSERARKGGSTDATAAPPQEGAELDGDAATA